MEKLESKTVEQLESEIAYFTRELQRTKSPDRLRRHAVSLALRQSALNKVRQLQRAPA